MLLELYANFTAALRERLPPRPPPQPPRTNAVVSGGDNVSTPSSRPTSQPLRDMSEMSFVLTGAEPTLPQYSSAAPTPDLSREASRFSYHSDRQHSQQHFTPPENVLTPEQSYKLGRGGGGSGLLSTPEHHTPTQVPLLTLGKKLLMGVENAMSPRLTSDRGGTSSRPGSFRLREMRETMQEKYKPGPTRAESDSDSDVESDVETPRNQLSLEDSIRMDSHAEFDLPTPTRLSAPRTPLVPKLMLPMETSASKLGGLTRSTRRSSAPGTERSLRSLGGSQRSLLPERSLLLSTTVSALAISEVPLYAGTGGSARAEMAQLAKELGETHLLADLTSLLAHRRYGPMRKAAGGKGARTAAGSKLPRDAPAASARSAASGGGRGAAARTPTSTTKASARAVGVLQSEQLAIIEACPPYRIKCLLLQALLALSSTMMASPAAMGAARNPVNLLAAELAAEAQGGLFSPMTVGSSRLRTLALHVLQAYTHLPRPSHVATAASATTPGDEFARRLSFSLSLDGRPPSAGSSSIRPGSAGAGAASAGGTTVATSDEARASEWAAGGAGRADALLWRLRARLLAVLGGGGKPVTDAEDTERRTLEEVERVLRLTADFVAGCSLEGVARRTVDVLGEPLVRVKHLLLSLGRFSGWKPAYLTCMDAFWQLADTLAMHASCNHLLAELLLTALFLGDQVCRRSLLTQTLPSPQDWP